MPYRNYRLGRMIEQSSLEVERMVGGLQVGRHGVEPDLSDAVGAFRAAQAADAARVVYPGRGSHPEPAWVAWVEEHGRYHPPTGGPDHSDGGAFAPGFAGGLGRCDNSRVAGPPSTGPGVGPGGVCPAVILGGCGGSRPGPGTAHHDASEATIRVGPAVSVVRYAPSAIQSMEIETGREMAVRWQFLCPDCGARPKRHCRYPALRISGHRSHSSRYQLAIDAGVVPWIMGFRRAPSETNPPSGVHPGRVATAGGDSVEDDPAVVAVEA